MKQLQRHSRTQPRLRSKTAQRSQRLQQQQQQGARAARIVAEQNRLLMNDNKALIAMVKRLRDELDDLKKGDTKTSAKRAKK